MNAVTTAPDSPDVNTRIAQRLAALRESAGLPLQALADRSGVSRSMISLIERGESSPTAAVLEKLATGLGLTLASFFEFPSRAASPVARRREQPTWVDPASGYRRRTVTPPGARSTTRLVEVEFPAGKRVAYDTASRSSPVDQHVWVLQGEMEVTVGSERWLLKRGDCLWFPLDRKTAFRNPTRQPARYAVVVTEQGRAP
jgi:transcriptional regulator with XRE-family HTH domain